MSNWIQLEKANGFLETIANTGGGGGGGSSEVDITHLDGNAIALNSGNLSAGVQRICIATNDVNISNLSSTVKTSAVTIYAAGDKINAISGILNSNSVSLSGNQGEYLPIAVDGTGKILCNLKVLDGVPIERNSGVLGNGVQRVCIASDDTVSTDLTTIKDDIILIKNDISTLQTNIATMLSIIQDVWDDGQNCLRIDQV